MQDNLKPCLTFYPTYDWELAFHIYIEREFLGANTDLYRTGLRGPCVLICEKCPTQRWRPQGKIRSFC